MKRPFFYESCRKTAFSLVVDIAQTIKNRAFNHTHNHTLATKKIGKRPPAPKPKRKSAGHQGVAGGGYDAVHETQKQRLTAVWSA